ncbi:MAG: monofunctional biosynthetic peptidoglycan transglycosylase [Pseudomonadota bacterium]
MAKTTSKPKTKAKSAPKPLKGPLLWRILVAVWRRPWVAFVRLWVRRVVLGCITALLLLIGVFAILPPPTTPYIVAEGMRQGGVTRDWVAIEDMAPVLARSVVAAEDANFCLHWGFDLNQIQAAIEDGAVRGASTLTQQTAKNVFLWQGRSWFRKFLETAITPVIEIVWSKRRIVEVYLNVAEFDAGVFGAEAAAQHYFNKPAADLTPREAARLAAVLPNPKERSAARPSSFVQRRAAAIADGAATIAADGRADCFQG